MTHDFVEIAPRRAAHQFLTPPPRQLYASHSSRDQIYYSTPEDDDPEFLHPDRTAYRRSDSYVQPIRKLGPPFRPPETHMVSSLGDGRNLCFSLDRSGLYDPAQDRSHLVERLPLQVRRGKMQSRMPSYDIDNSQFMEDFDEDNISSVSQHCRRKKEKENQSSQNNSLEENGSVKSSSEVYNSNMTMYKIYRGEQQCVKRVIPDGVEELLTDVYGNTYQLVRPREIHNGSMISMHDNREEAYPIGNGFQSARNRFNNMNSSSASNESTDRVFVSPSKQYLAQNRSRVNNTGPLTVDNVEAHEQTCLNQAKWHSTRGRVCIGHYGISGRK